MKVGLCLAYKTNNYGQILQAFATQYFIDSLGYETEILDYKRTGFKHVRLSFGLFYNYFLTYRDNKNKKKLELDDLHKENLIKRKIASNQFRNDHFQDIVKCNGIEELEKKALEYNTVIVGSDQNWLPSAVFGNYFTLRFVPDKVNKVSYATSIGVSEYPDYCKRSAAQFLRRLDYISVREVQGKKVLSALCDNPIQVVVDPTLLLTKDDWITAIPPKKVLQEKYIFCYFLGDSEWQLNCAKKYATENNYKLVIVLSTENTSNYASEIADYLIMDAGPAEFINYIRYSECVFTDSFHGTIFSVIHSKPFYVFYRIREGSFKSRNSRIDGLLNLLGLNERLIDSAENAIKIHHENIEYGQITSIIEKERNKSIGFLKDALERKKHEYN